MPFWKHFYPLQGDCGDWIPVDQSSTIRQWQRGTATTHQAAIALGTDLGSWGPCIPTIPCQQSCFPGARSSNQSETLGGRLFFVGVFFLPDHWFQPFLSTCQLFCSTSNKPGSPETPLSVIFLLQLKNKLPVLKCITCWQKER